MKSATKTFKANQTYFSTLLCGDEKTCMAGNRAKDSLFVNQTFEPSPKSAITFEH